MALTVSVTPSATFPAGMPITLASLRKGALPSVSVSGGVGSVDLAPRSVSQVKMAPDAYFYGLDTGAPNGAAVAILPAVTSYFDGLVVAFKVGYTNTNTGAATLAVNGLAAMPVVKNGNLPLTTGDWIADQIVVVRYQLDANILASGVFYDGSGNYVLPVTIGRSYVWSKNANELTLVNGSQTLNATGSFTATGSTVTLTGTASLLVTATVIPSSNVWQMLSQLGNPSRSYAPFVPPSTYVRGHQGLVPGPLAGQQQFYLRADGVWVDLLTQATNAANATAQTYVEIFKLKHFI